ncbi:kelch-like protein 32 isoform X2 [Ciona intestinalis]
MGGTGSRFVCIKACNNVSRTRETYRRNYVAPALPDELFVDKDIFSVLFQSLNEMRKNEEMTDTIIHCGDRVYPCHSVVLYYCCKYFHDLVVQAVNDSGTKDGLVITAKEIPEQEAKFLLQYMYTGKVSLPFDCIGNFSDAAVQWGLHEKIELHEKVSLGRFCSNSSSVLEMLSKILIQDEIDSSCIQLSEEKFMSENFFSCFSQESRMESKETELNYNVVLSPENGEGIRCHRELLSTFSSYFHSMFRVGDRSYMEATEDSVKLYGVDHDTLQVIVDYIYTGKVQFTPENINSILKAAGWICPESELLKQGSLYLIERVTTQNCFQTETFAESYALTQLKEACSDFILRNLSQTKSSLSFTELSSEHLRSVLSDDRHFAVSEKELFDAVLDWGVSHSAVEVLDLLSKVIRTSLMDISDLEASVEAVMNFGIPSHPTVDFFKDSLRFAHLAPMEERILETGQKHRECSTETVVLLTYCYQNLTLQKLCRTQDFKKSTETFKKVFEPTDINSICSKTCSSYQPRIPMVCYAVQVVNGRIFITGGFYCSKTKRPIGTVFDTTLVYCPKKHQWFHGPIMNNARHSHDMLVVGDSIYVIGGKWFETNRRIGGISSRKNINTIERLRISGGVWEKIGKFPTKEKVLKHMSVALSSVIYMFCSGKVTSQLTLHRYSTREQDWMPPVNITTPIYSSIQCMATFKGKIYGFSIFGTKYQVFPFDSYVNPRFEDCIGLIKRGENKPFFYNDQLITVKKDRSKPYSKQWKFKVQPFDAALYQPEMDLGTGDETPPTENIVVLHTYLPEL